MFIKHKVVVNISKNSDGSGGGSCMEEADAEVLIDGRFEKRTDIELDLEEAEIMDLPLGDMGTAAGFYLKLDGDVDVTINGQGPIPMRRANPEDSASTATWLLEGEFTALTIENVTAGTIISGRFIAWGAPPSEG